MKGSFIAEHSLKLTGVAMLGKCDLMKGSEDLQDYGLEDEGPAAALGTKLEEVGINAMAVI